MYFCIANQKSNTMKRLYALLWSMVMTATVWAASGINYDGTDLTLNNDFTRTECGTSYKSVMKEISGMACSRTTKGFLWAHGDENTGDNKKIIAILPSGNLAMTVNIAGDPGRDDWEDIATGVYNSKNYIFLGAFGDNEHAYNDQYYIYYFEEPAVTSGSQTVNVNYIRFGYPDNTAHNTETLMYDNVEQVIYIADKEDGVCHLYKLPFRTDYGTGVQRLTEVCALGTSDKFKECNGGDITPDGKWMAIKNEKYILLWERQDNESLAVTATRRPVQIAAYEKEEQGESLAWLNDSLFYTTSDSKENTPIYQYVRWNASTPDDPPIDPQPVDSTLKAINEVVLSNGYSAYINEDETVIRGWYLAGESEPSVKSYILSEGATWTQTVNNVTITALDGSNDSYTLNIQPVTPVAFSATEIVLDGSESSWVKSAYGWDSTKKWRFSKTDDDYSREIAGKTHVEFFLPACDTVVIKSMSTERKVQFLVNGAPFGSVTKLLTAGNTLVVEQSAPFMLSVVSAQNSGDGGVAAIRMARKQGSSPTSIDQVTDNQTLSTQKMLIDGRFYILRADHLYDAEGRLLK